MRKHELKVWPGFFKHLWSGDKTFDVCKDDRLFRVGDVLELREWSKLAKDYAGREITAEVIYIFTGIGLLPGYIAMSISILDKRF